MTKPVWACSQDLVSKRWKYHLPQPPEHSAVGAGAWLLKAPSAPTPLSIAHTAMTRQAVTGLQQPGCLQRGNLHCSYEYFMEFCGSRQTQSVCMHTHSLFLSLSL